ncbi:heavy metal-responsive transcriptional regulator [Anabaena sp. FACHB-709]|uniref:Transcriptional regulator n=2 Tax=Nostocaceae TaxID=1162 RepID=A0A1Z4KE38_ANAVA|nr:MULTISPECIES: heavy metal-responsive transcriptional regulator [Nostocaceae]BAY67250.1 transcriptional regulator [Trichormus variabilis NIES-23]HBW30426.1 heavy metal-responsive transcriptional regulator [Nostoc sp. UBA8866]MBD2173095.1 heavy metal-responsive transcriptional regulator [Anabaena cylindrica FACHB-318]MBD2264916.1 heavy metal-responsive transcriptional regulator [Anabaena sp. FACHB-709]MBD2274019.1 heavy metal-responsive transcriptional regulator [Nostoc sp. PCC 7120 = FACHB-4
MLAQTEAKQIGVVAKESGVPIKTIRYYEELGLLTSSGRTEGGFRLFNSDVLARLHFIKRAQSLGLSLSEIKEFLNVHDGGELPCEHIKIKLEDKVKAIDEQIQQLLILRQELSGLLSGWEIKPDNSHKTICPIIEH